MLGFTSSPQPTITRPFPYAAPSIGAFFGNSPLGVRQGCRTLPEGQGCPFWQTLINARSAGSKRHPGRIFFGYFLLAKQKKVPRLPVREPVFKQLSRYRHITLMCSSFDKLRTNGNLLLISWFDKLTTYGSIVNLTHAACTISKKLTVTNQNGTHSVPSTST